MPKKTIGVVELSRSIKYPYFCLFRSLLNVLSFTVCLSDFPGSVVSSSSESPQRLRSVWSAILGADQKSRPLGTRIKRKDLGPSTCLIEAELVKLAFFVSENENGDENYRLLEAKSRDLQGEWSRSHSN